MSRETENPTPPKREAPTPHPAEAVEACFRDDNHQRPFIDRVRIVEAAKKWAELREAVNEIILENAFYRREMNTIRDENAELRRLLDAARRGG